MYQSNNETRNAAPAPRVPQESNHTDRSAIKLAAVTVIIAVVGIIACLVIFS